MAACLVPTYEDDCRIVERRQAKAWSGGRKPRCVEDARPRCRCRVQTGQVAYAPVALLALLGAAQVVDEFGGDRRPIAFAHRRQLCRKVGSRGQRALQVFGAVNLHARGGQLRQHLPQRRRHLLGRAHLHQELLRRQAQPFRLGQPISVEHLLGKGAGNAGCPAAAQHCLQPREVFDRTGILPCLCLVNRGGKHLVGLVAEEGRMVFHHALRVVPGVQPDKTIQKGGQGWGAIFAGHNPGIFRDSGIVVGRYLPRRRLQLGMQVGPRGQRAFQVFGAVNLHARRGQFCQHLPQRRRHLFGRAHLRQERLGRQAHLLGLSQRVRRQHLLGEGAGNAGFPAAAQQGAVGGEHRHGVGIVRVLRQRQGEAFVGFVAQQRRVRLDDALRLVPRRRGEKLVDHVGQSEGEIVIHLPGSSRASGKVVGRRAVLLRHGRFQPGLQVGPRRQRPLQVFRRLHGHAVVRQLPQHGFQRRRHRRRRFFLYFLTRYFLPQFPHRRGGIVAQRHRQQFPLHRGHLRQPVILPGGAQALRQRAQQPAGHLLVLLGAGLLGRGKDQRRLACGRVGAWQVEEQGRVHRALGTAAGTGHRVQIAGAGVCGQVGPLVHIDDQPDVRGEGLPADRAGQLCTLGVGVGHGDLAAQQWLDG